ncbi:MAG: 3-isopropylmalate dehydratase small subunit [Jatrophihabitans sp.]
MRAVKQAGGTAVMLDRDDVDTDQIIPAEFCKRLGRTGYADALFAHWRSDPDFVLNQPLAADASVLVGGHNFGTGSSREHAVWALRDWGFRVVLASSFGDIFYRNALVNGLLAVPLPPDQLDQLRVLLAARPTVVLVTDLEACTVTAGELCFAFGIEPKRRQLLLLGLDDIGNTLLRETEISRYEAHRTGGLPQVRRGAISGRAEPALGRWARR